MVDSDAPGSAGAEIYGIDSIMTDGKQKANNINPKEFWKPILCELSTKSRVAGKDNKPKDPSDHNLPNTDLPEIQMNKQQSSHNEPLTHEDKVKRAMELKEIRRQ